MERRTVQDVPDSEVNFVVAVMKADGAEVTQTRQSNGLWTVVGVFPDRPGMEPGVPSAPAERPPSEVGGAGAGVEDRATAVDVLARTIWGEARGEARQGKEAVAAVILNRLRRGPAARFGGSIEEVCQKRAQFSCWNESDPNRPKLLGVDTTDADFRECLEIAELAANGQLADATAGATHYHTTAVSPNWSQGKTPCARIGAHVFFNDIA